MSKINISIQAFSITLIVLILYYMFSMNLFTLVIFILGVLITYLLIQSYGVQSKETPFYFTLAGFGAFITYFFFNNVLFIGLFLLGANIIAFFLYANNEKQHVQKGIQILSVISLSGLVLESGIKKFRGFNKLEFDDIQITIALIVLIAFSVYFLVQILKILLKSNKNTSNYLAIVSVLFIAVAYYFLSYYFYSEIGLSKIYVPLLYGLIVAIIDHFFSGRNLPKDFVQITLLFISSYAVSGILGIFLAFVSAYLFKDIVGNNLKLSEKEINMDQDINAQRLGKKYNSLLDSTSQLLFLFAAIEIQENAGYIMRFNLSVGFQLGWLLISVILYEYALNLFYWGKKLLDRYALISLLSVLTTLTVIVSVAIIMKLGHIEAVASLLIASSMYLLLMTLIKIPIYKNYWFVILLSNVIGAMTFLILALA